MANHSKYRPEFCELVVEFMKDGQALQGFAGEVGVSRKTLYNWIDKHKAFAEAVEIAKSASYKWWLQKGIDAVQGKVLHFSAGAWAFSMKNLHGWTDKQEVTGRGGGNVVVEIVEHYRAKK